ncbi:MAG: hypothetical protein FJ270_06675 [Planctomycetes bacterium]|nr:hypothetical protein [Planctomycetota bacterium]
MPRCWLSSVRCVASAMAAAAVAATASGDLVLNRAGFGGVVRLGGIVPVQLEVSLPVGDTREGVDAEVVVEVPNVDGDIAEYSIRSVLSSGATSIWVYPSIATGVSGKPIALASYERDDGQRGRLLERVQVIVEQPYRGAIQVEPSVDIVGVVAGGHCGMAAWDPGQQSPCLGGYVTVGEVRETTDLPDRVEGWSGFKAVVWAGVPLTSLLPAQDNALRAWVEGGGRLVLQVSAAADGFSLDGAQPEWIADALKGLAWTRVEDVKASTLAPIISSQNLELRKDGTQPLTTFSECGAPWAKLVAMPVPRAWNGVPEPRRGTLDAACIVVERPLGTGTLVVSGLDADALNRRRYVESDLPEADIWWNRIMGRRGDTPPRAKLREWSLAQPSPIEQHPRSVEIGGSEFFNAFIGMQSTAANLTSISILLFAAYWLIAGPVSFYILRQRKQERWSWLAFVVIACAFGAVAWLAGTVLRQADARAQHLTVVDAVVSPGALPGTQPAIRTQTWASAFLPNYGTAEVSLPGAQGVLRPFSPVGDDGEFPDATRYTVQASRPGALTLPARATATMVTGSWSGDLPSAWRGLPAVSGAPLQQTSNSTRSADAAPASYLTGKLKHGLPAALTDVLILHVTPFRPAPPRFNERATAGTKAVPVAPSDAMPSMVFAYRHSSWEPGTELELANMLYPAVQGRQDRAFPVIDPADPGVLGLDAAVDAMFISPLRQAFAPISPGGSPGEKLAREHLTMMSLYGMLPDPRWWAAAAAARGPTEGEVRVQRVAGHALDLGPWCSRPCVIVMGFLAIEPGEANLDGSPVPLSIDGDAVPMSGTTLVRVIFPLPQADALVPATMIR